MSTYKIAVIPGDGIGKEVVPEGIRVLGPAAAAMVRLKNEYRYQMLIKSNSRQKLNEILQQVRAFALREKWNATALVMDVDPVTML